MGGVCGVVGDGRGVWCGGGWEGCVVWWGMGGVCGVVGDGRGVWCGGGWEGCLVWWGMGGVSGVVGDGRGVWCGGGWEGCVVWWGMGGECGVVGDGRGVWCGGGWEGCLVWWGMGGVCGVVGDGRGVWCGGGWGSGWSFCPARLLPFCRLHPYFCGRQEGGGGGVQRLAFLGVFSLLIAFVIARSLCWHVIGHDFYLSTGPGKVSHVLGRIVFWGRLFPVLSVSGASVR